MTTRRASEQTHDLAHQNLSAAGRGTQPGRLNDRRGKAVLLLERDVPRTDPDAHLQRHVARTRLVVAIESLLDRHGGSERVRRSCKGGHDPVTEVLDEPSPLCLDRASDEPIVLLAKLLGRVLAQPGPKLGRPDQIREDHDRGRALHPAALPHHAQMVRRSSGHAIRR